MISRKPGSLTSGESDSVLLVGPIAARDEARTAVFRLVFVGNPACQTRGFDVQFMHQMLGGVVGLADAVGGEGVGFGDVGAGLEIGAVDRFGHFGLGQGEDVVVALLVLGQAQGAGVVGFGQLPALDFGAEGAIGDEDALGRLGQQGFARGHAIFSGSRMGALTLGRIPSRWQIA